MGLLGKSKRDTNSIGDISESAIITRFLQLGYTVLMVHGGNQRYDLVIEDAEGQFWRVQCKTAWVEGGDDGYIKFATTSLRSRSTNGKVQYSRARYTGQIEYFA